MNDPVRTGSIDCDSNLGIRSTQPTIPH